MVVVVIMPHPPHTLDVVPAGPPEQRGVDTAVAAHGAVGQVVDCPELLVQQLRRVLVEPGDGGESLLVPAEVLDPEGVELVLPPGEVHVLEVDVLHEVVDLRLEDRLEPDINNFVEDLNFQYVDFAKTPGNYSTFRIQDFSWDEEGFSIIARFDEETAQLLDEKFRTIYNLTYGTMGSHSSIDTSLFRRASWNYIQCLWGVR